METKESIGATTTLNPNQHLSRNVQQNFRGSRQGTRIQKRFRDDSGPRRIKQSSVERLSTAFIGVDSRHSRATEAIPLIGPPLPHCALAAPFAFTLRCANTKSRQVAGPPRGGAIFNAGIVAVTGIPSSRRRSYSSCECFG